MVLTQDLQTLLNISSSAPVRLNHHKSVGAMTTVEISESGLGTTPTKALISLQVCGHKTQIHDRGVALKSLVCFVWGQCQTHKSMTEVLLGMALKSWLCFVWGHMIISCYHKELHVHLNKMLFITTHL